MAVFRGSFGLSNVIGNYRNFLSPRICVTSYNRCLSAKGKMTEEEIGLPPRPKKPLPPFFRYLEMKRPTAKLEHPELKLTELTKLLSEGWATFDPMQKDMMQKQYDQEMLLYAKSFSEYKKSITPEQKLKIKLAKEQKKISKEKSKDRQKNASFGKPKKPMSSFLRYIQSRKHEYDKTKISYKDFLNSVKQEYNALPESKKVELREEFMKDLQEYKVAIIEWEKKMIKLGYPDVVRNSSTLNIPQTYK
ncbi:transcription factor A, mitochondrial [Cephus cinctus]|uniref:Transcription factor A, mitochondrial n=1 Tax=Cephus cinctus TaxID=211228 RepID=A0AAJ7FKZ9_CEPCN|nr:transcription factor A, mitochondrial [Cephus cinctus]